jgi:amidohydrolase
MIDFLAEAEELFPYAQKLRRDFHMHPELGFQEVRTSGIVAEELNKLGIEVTTGIAETGVIGIIEGTGPGKVLLIRFDMDALPIVEETGAEYASQNDGVMHACGHDGHTAVGLSVAKLLHKHKDQFNGTVKLVFQPAEEGLGGALRMVKEGVLENPRPDYSLGMHVWNDNLIGEVIVTTGPAMAGAEMFSVKITGKGAHGAAPHLGHDPIAASAQMISAMQTIASRNVDPLKSAVVSVTAIHGGTAFNIIPPSVELKGTIRTFEPEVREMVHRRMKEIIHGIAESMECEAEIEVVDVTPAVINDAELAALVREQAKTVLPDAKVIDGLRTMGSEDMAYMMDDIPGCYMFIASKNEEKGLVYGHHHPKFDIDERALINGIALVSASAVEVLSRNN